MMNIRIYQINMKRDTLRVAFESLDSMERLLGSENIDSSIYDRVFEGSVDCNSLEDIFRKFNIDHPVEFRGRSLSVSDVVEVIEADEMTPGFYFCNDVGFKGISFQADKAEVPTHNTIRVVLLEPGKSARVADIDSSLEGLQRVVGGNIAACYPFEEKVCIVSNNEGKIKGMPLNRAIRGEDTIIDMDYKELKEAFRLIESSGSGRHLTGYIVFSSDSFDEPFSLESRTYVVSSNNKAYQPNMGGYSIFGSCLDGTDQIVRLEQYMAAEHGGANGWKIERCYAKEPSKEIIEIIAGPCFICDCSGENFGSLSEEQLRRFSRQFKNPERFVRMNDGIEAVPYKPSVGPER